MNTSALVVLLWLPLVMAQEAAGDWYDRNVMELLIIFSCSLTSFLVFFLILLLCTRLRFQATTITERETADTPELCLIKSHTRAIRFLSLVSMGLQSLLLSFVLQIPDTERSAMDYAFSLFRPVSNLCVHFLGFMTNTHGAFRSLYLILLCGMVATDTIAQVTVAMIISCMQQKGRLCGDNPITTFTLADFQVLQLRDFVMLFLNPWTALEAAYLCVAIGFCRSRYSVRKLSLSRPPFNVRAALATFFPSSTFLPARRIRPKGHLN